MKTIYGILKFWNFNEQIWEEFNVGILAISDLKKIGDIIHKAHPGMTLAIFDQHELLFRRPSRSYKWEKEVTDDYSKKGQVTL